MKKKHVAIPVALVMALSISSLCGCTGGAQQEENSQEQVDATTVVKPEVTQEELLEGLNNAFTGIPVSEFVGKNNSEIISYLIQNGCVQKLDADGSGYWTDIYNIYYIKDMDGNALSPSAAGQNADTYVSIATSFPTFEPSTLEMLMEQVTSSEITGYRENVGESGTNAVGVATIGDSKYLVTVERPSNDSPECIVNVYLGGGFPDVDVAAAEYQL